MIYTFKSLDNKNKYINPMDKTSTKGIQFVEGIYITDDPEEAKYIQQFEDIILKSVEDDEEGEEDNE